MNLCHLFYRLQIIYVLNFLTHIYINLCREKKTSDSHKSYTIRKRRSSLVRKPLLVQRNPTGIRSFRAPKRVKSDFFKVFSDMPCDTSYHIQMSCWLQKWSQILKILKIENFMAGKLENFKFFRQKPYDTCFYIKILCWIWIWCQVLKIVKFEKIWRENSNNLNVFLNNHVWYMFRYENVMFSSNLKSDFENLRILHSYAARTWGFL